jgi:rhamnose utilization protein RhaD (predicted bifunctional aldolase and dehydrogenase)
MVQIQRKLVASEFYLNAINVMKGAEAVSEYVALPLALVQFLFQL